MNAKYHLIFIFIVRVCTHIMNFDHNGKLSRANSKLMAKDNNYVKIFIH